MARGAFWEAPFEVGDIVLVTWVFDVYMDEKIRGCPGHWIGSGTSCKG